MIHSSVIYFFWMKMAFEKRTVSSIDAIFEWLMKVEFMAAHQDRDFMRHAIKVMRDVGVGVHRSPSAR